MIRHESDLTYIDRLVDRIADFLGQDVLEMTIDGLDIRGYRSPDAKSVWIRDYSEIIRGARYIEKDMHSVVQHFADTQAANGRVFDYFTTFPEKLPCEKENWTKYVRIPVEADVEYRFVKAAWLCYQANNDLNWLQTILPSLVRAVTYSMSHPDRWSQEHQLVKRPYTIDTWDFAYTAGQHDWLQFQIDKNTYWGIFHGDNSGLFEAARILADIFDLLAEEEQVLHWRSVARRIRSQLNATCWNGRFYTHFVKISSVDIPGIDEDQQLSLSNPATLNRGVGSPEMAAAMLREYQNRKDQSDAFAPWFSIDPPFPDGSFGDEKLIKGSYINGGIFPLAGGELSLLALENGFEKYGFEQILQYEELTRNEETYLWYFPDGRPSSVETSTSPDATPTDGWGSSAFLHAIVQGLAGIEDLRAGFTHIHFAPRWAAAFSKKASIELTYPASGAAMDCQYEFGDREMVFRLNGPFQKIDAHIYIPDYCCPLELIVNNTVMNFERSEINDSKYINFTLVNNPHPEIRILYDLIKT